MAPADVNAAVAGALRDMSDIQTTPARQWGYKQAAAAIRELEVAVTTLVATDGTLGRIPRIGPASSRIVLEMLASGRSETVESAVDESGRRAQIEQRRAWRVGFLSRAAVGEVLALGTLPASQGDLQMHSTWSDGQDSLAAMAAGCIERGYHYAAITDHSGGLPVAHGLSDERLAAQAEELERVNETCTGRFRFLRGVEANIGADGTVDVSADRRRQLDIVVAAPHSGLRSATPQTARMLGAVETPGVHVLGHPRGRKYGQRAGILADWPRIFAAAATLGVAVEIDGDPSRQDLDAGLAQQALTAGCLFALDSDAHAVDQLGYADIARAHAVLAGIPAERIVNCWPLERLLAWAARRHEGLGANR